MRNEQALTPADREFEQALSGLAPAGPSIDKNRLMFEAGRRSVQRSIYTWRAVAAVLAVGVSLSLAIPRQPREIEKVVYVTSDKETPTVATPEKPFGTDMTELAHRSAQEPSYLRLQRSVLAGGLDALPDGTGFGSTVSKTRLDLNELLDRPDDGSSSTGGSDLNTLLDWRTQS